MTAATWEHRADASSSLGEVGGGASALSPSQAAIDLKLAQDAFEDAIKHWREYTPREVGELAERWWVCLKTLRDSVTA